MSINSQASTSPDSDVQHQHLGQKETPFFTPQPGFMLDHVVKDIILTFH